MATRFIKREPAPVTRALEYSHSTELERLCSTLGRHRIGDAIEVLIAILDATEPDPDSEDDDPAGLVDEDGVNTITEREYLGLPRGFGPGCEMADLGGTSGLDCP